MLPLKRVRPTGASRRLRPTEYPTFFTKIETQAPTFPNANPWARCGIWASAINTATVRSQRSSRKRAGLRRSAVFAFRQRGRTSDSRLPESRPRRSPPRPIPCPDAARTAVDLLHSSHAPEPGTTRSQPRACTNFGTSTSTGLDSHVASNCRFGKQVATACRKAGVGQCLAREHRMTPPRMYRPLSQGLRLERPGPVLAASRTNNQVVLARRSASSADIWLVHRQRHRRPPRQVCETGFSLDRLRTLPMATAVCASRGNTIWSM